MNIPRSIILLASVRHSWEETDKAHSFKGVCPNVIFLSGIEGVQCGKEALMVDGFLNWYRSLIGGGG